MADFLSAVGGGLVGGFAGYKSQQDTNRTNRKIANARNAMEVEEAEKARVFSAAESQRNRDWQETMSNTSYQRAMADMKAAGLNPALAGAGPATTPSGGVGSTAKANIDKYEHRNEGAAFLSHMSTALDLQRKVSEIENIEAQTKLTSNKGDVVGPLSTMADVLQKWLQDPASDAKSANPYAKAKDFVQRKNEMLRERVEGAVSSTANSILRAKQWWQGVKDDVKSYFKNGPERSKTILERNAKRRSNRK